MKYQQDNTRYGDPIDEDNPNLRDGYPDLTPILEEDDGFRLVLHQRDFMPGRLILENIAEAVQRSRRMIVLLSRYC